MDRICELKIGYVNQRNHYWIIFSEIKPRIKIIKVQILFRMNYC